MRELTASEWEVLEESALPDPCDEQAIGSLYGHAFKGRERQYDERQKAYTSLDDHFGRPPQ